MIYNNLNRIKGILSARLGALIPKFQNSGKIYKKLPNGIEVFSLDNGISWMHVNNPNLYYDNVNNEEFLNLESYDEITRDMNISREKLLMQIPGYLLITPTTSVEEATRNINDINLATQDLKNRSQAFQQTLLEVNSLPKSLNEGDKNRLLSIIDNNIDKTGTKLLKKLAGMSTTERETYLDKTAQAGDIVDKVATAAVTGLGNVFGAQQSATDSNLTKGIDSGVDAAGGMLSQMGGIAGGIGLILQIGSAAGQIIEGITGGTDQMTAADKFFDSGIGTVLGGWVNQLWGKNSEAFGIDLSMAETVGSSYGGSMDLLNEAAKTADKKYGLFSSKARKRDNEAINKAKQTLNLMSNVADAATDQRLAVQSMGEQAGIAYSMMTDGGYNLKYTYAAKHGGLLEWNPVVELEWEPQVELNWALPTFKEGGNVNLIEELEWIPELQKSGKTRTLEELIEYAKKENPRFIQRLSEEPRGIKFINDEGKEGEGNVYLEWSTDNKGNAIIYPRIQEFEDGTLKFLSSNEAYNRAIDNNNVLIMSPEEAEIFFAPDEEYLTAYKRGWPAMFKSSIWKHKQGGSVKESDVPEIEETNLKNVIPEGALHKNKHHMEHAEGLTKKGIPVVDEDGEQQAEIEHSEIIFTLEVTKKLEEYYEIFYSEESTNKEKEQAALDAGKLLVYQILENTEDRTGLIESCKKGGSLTLKKSTDDLIEEVLEWMPTIVVVETEEPEESKEDKPKKKEVDTSKEELKLMIKEVLVELLIK